MSTFLCCECQCVKDPDYGYHPCKMHPGEAFCRGCEETMSEEQLKKCYEEDWMKNFQKELDNFVNFHGDKIDEAKKREAFGDLSLIAYDLLNKCAILKIQKDKLERGSQA